MTSAGLITRHSSLSEIDHLCRSSKEPSPVNIRSRAAQPKLRDRACQQRLSASEAQTSPTVDNSRRQHQETPSYGTILCNGYWHRAEVMRWQGADAVRPRASLSPPLPALSGISLPQQGLKSLSAARNKRQRAEVARVTTPFKGGGVAGQLAVPSPDLSALPL